MLRDILLLQKREIETRLKEPYIERLAHKLKINNNLIKVIIGPRRAGKSFFALHFLSKEAFGYVNFDDEKIIDLKDYDELIEVLKSVYNFLCNFVKSWLFE